MGALFHESNCATPKPTEKENSARLSTAVNELSALPPESFLLPSQETARRTRNALKLAYESALGLKGVGDPPVGLLLKLHVDGFDCEQIWQQMEQRLLPFLKSLKAQVRKAQRIAGQDDKAMEEEFFGAAGMGYDPKDSSGQAIAEAAENGEAGEEDEIIVGGGAKVTVEVLGADEGLVDVEDEEEEEEEGEEEEDEEEDDIGREGDVLGGDDSGIRALLYSGSAFSDEEGQDEDTTPKQTHLRDKISDASDSADENEERPRKKRRANGVGDSDGGGEGGMRYEDFYGPEAPPPATIDADEDEDEEGGVDPDGEVRAEEPEDAVFRRVAALLAGGVEDEEVVRGEEREEGPRSEYQRQQERMRRRLERLEQANLNPKPWMLSGEVTAGGRPKNSALEVDVEFEHAARPAPVVTEELTASLEDVIKQRIREQRFDDVVRRAPRAPPFASLRGAAGGVELDEKKSTKGLAEIYEAQYLESAAAEGGGGGGGGAWVRPDSREAVEQGVKKVAAALFTALCAKLDALSHFHFTPKPVFEDAAAAPPANVPAIAVEEVAPAAASFASMLTPEEVFAGGRGEAGSTMGLGGVRGSAAGQLKAAGELGKEERRRIRNKLKRKWRAEKKGQDGAVEGSAGVSVAPRGSGGNQVLGMKTGAKKGRGGAALDSKGGAKFSGGFTNSAKFFGMLQEEQSAPKPALRQREGQRAAAVKL